MWFAVVYQVMMVVEYFQVGGLLGGGMGESGTAGTVGSAIGRVVIIPDGRVTTRVVFSVEVVGGQG